MKHRFGDYQKGDEKLTRGPYFENNEKHSVTPNFQNKIFKFHNS